MIISTIILGWSGIILFLITAFIFPKMAKNNEFAFIHFLLAWMYAFWLPVPLVLNQLLDFDYLQIGIIFGFIYLFMLIITMVLQTGHITYIVKNNTGQAITDKESKYMMATLSDPFEAFANVFKSIWALFLAIGFWNNGEYVMGCLMILFSLFGVYYLFLILNNILVTPVKLFAKVKPNVYVTNLETFLFFLILLIYIT
ncbi:hypothetical protein [Oceanobacillus sojae]|uniref:Uncharacterized protein n=1 Tax=Oceanobacillus sojae TaxID=582851 RepID=A0A511ZEP0_9BACI|nr:hypothetical protein [Oceanobacillus sojae]GEN85912.1 hypothetical protein OSO01_06510 [Oceanobacillus sojae]